MKYKMPLKFILNEDRKITDVGFTILFSIINSENFTNESDCEINTKELKHLLGIADNRTIKKNLEIIKELNVIKDYRLTSKGFLSVKRVIVPDENWEIELPDLIFNKHRLIWIIFYLSYYRSLQLENKEQYYFTYVSTKNMSSVLNCSEETMTRALEELRKHSNYKFLTDKSIFPVKEKYRMILPKVKNNPRTTNDERKLEDFLEHNIDSIEKGMKFIGRQVPVNHGFIDILAKDKNNNKCVIELKSVKNDKRLPYQCLYYPTQIIGNTRMLVIAPDYRDDMMISLNKLEVELFTYKKTGNEYIINKYYGYGI